AGDNFPITMIDRTDLNLDAVRRAGVAPPAETGHAAQCGHGPPPTSRARRRRAASAGPSPGEVREIRSGGIVSRRRAACIVIPRSVGRCAGRAPAAGFGPYPW